MVTNRKPSGRAATIPIGLLTGGIAALISTLALTALLAKLMEGEILSEGNIGYGVMIMLLISAFLGSTIACKRVKRQFLMTAALSGVVYILLLLSITALFFGGQYSGVGVTVLLVCCGSLLAAMVFSRGGKGRKIRKSKVKNR